MVVVTARAIRALIVAITLGLILAPVTVAQPSTPAAPDSSWQFVDVEITPNAPTAGQVAIVRFTIEDGTGSPVPGLRATGQLRAPSTAYDNSPPTPALTTVGRELGEPGRYEVAVALNEAGRWWIELQVESDDGQVTGYDHFTIVERVEDSTPASTEDPVFLRSNEWDTYYRIDPNTGSVATLAGDELFPVNDRWWLAEVIREPTGVIDAEYGGTWQLTFNVRDAITGDTIASIDVGNVRAGVYPGSQRDPAIATSITVAPDGGEIYLYWARQLGRGWVGNVAVADPETGEIINQRVLNGAVVSNGFWAEIYLLDDENLVIAEQVVEFASVSGYRLSVANRETLEVATQYRRTDARDDPLTHCILTFPGPIGHVNGGDRYRYSLCSPPESEYDLALVVWSPVAGQSVHTVDLDRVAASDSYYVDGIASPDGTRFYAVNSRTMRIAEIDMLTGEVLRERSLYPEGADPSTLDRFFDWFFGAFNPSANAAGIIKPAVTIDPQGETLYMISQPENRDPGVLVVDLESLEVTNRLLSGQVVDGVLATPDGRLAVVEHDSETESDTVTILDGDGGTHLSFLLPGRSDVIGSRR